MKNNGYDLAYVRVEILDKDGWVVPRSNNLLKFSISGPAEIVATDNGDATSLRMFSSREREAYNGLCLVIVRALQEKIGQVVLTIESPDLQTENVKLTVVDRD